MENGKTRDRMKVRGDQAHPKLHGAAVAQLRPEIEGKERVENVVGQKSQQQKALDGAGVVTINVVRVPAIDQFVESVILSGEGLARCRGVPRSVFQSLPIRTAREDFPQAAHPVGFVERVMGRARRLRLSLSALYPGQWLDRPIPVEPEYTVKVFVTPSPPSDARLSPPLASRE